MQMKKRIAIVGGGPGGLTLARILSLHGLAASVLEYDEHPLARPQGGSLDLHGEGAQRALREARLEAEFSAVARTDDQYDLLYDKHGTLLFEHGSADGDRPEVDRTQLRQILLDSLPPGTVRWNQRVRAVEPCADGRYRIVAGADLGEFDLVVGADGAFSRVRPLLGDVRPSYSGVSFVELSIDAIDDLHPELAALVPRGKFFAVEEGRGLIVQRSSGGHVRVYAALRVPEAWLREGPIDFSAPERARATLKAQFPGWSERLLAFIDRASDLIIPRPIVALPVGHRWPHRAGVTLLGDAAHVMSPFGGNGVNLAMIDATELALSLVSESDWDVAVATYEERMFERAIEPARGAQEGLESFLTAGGLDHVRSHFEQVSGAAAPTAQRP
jgi:2-polyprenyl-6-methoxyphenol hydroxylase-like FAD-dependent oxidoreductase